MGEVLFENTHVIAEKELRGAPLSSQSAGMKLRFWRTMFISLLFTLMTISMLFFYLYYRQIEILALMIFYAFLAACFFSAPASVGKRNYKQYAKLMKGDVQKTYRFGEEIAVIGGNLSATYTYDQICYIEEKEERIYLWLDASIAMGLHKNTFTCGNASDFIAFIQEKCAETNSLWTRGKFFTRIFKNQALHNFLFLVLLVVCGYLLYLFL